MPPSPAYQVVTAANMTHQQKVNALSAIGENTLDVLKIPPKFQYYSNHGAVCDMNEGHAPYRPRYVMVDYERFVRQGSDFLRLCPPRDLDELLHNLTVLYHHVPSITNKPVYLGNLDKLIDPFLDGMTDEQALPRLRRFMDYCDRTIANAYSHANLGPEATRAGRLILHLEAELKNEVPNFSLKYDPAITPDDFAEQALACSIQCANPAICNHTAHKDTYSFDYGISSCYNVLPLRGGAYTLSRIVLPRLAKMASSIEQFLQELLPDALLALGQYMNERIRFLVEESGFFKSSFLVQEGLIARDRFVGMFGVAGLCDCVNWLMRDENLRYGIHTDADCLGEKIMMVISGFSSDFPAKYSEIAGGRFLLHAQAGLSTDEGVTSGVRIIVGDEPESLLDHFRHSAKFHRFFPTGCSDIFPFEKTVLNKIGRASCRERV